MLRQAIRSIRALVINGAVRLQSATGSSSVFQGRNAKKKSESGKLISDRDFRNQLWPSYTLSVPTMFRSYSAPHVSKKFTVNGAINSLREGYFYLDTAEENQRTLIPGIRGGDYIMLYGPRGSGKSTRMFRAIEQLQSEFTCLEITFQQGVDMRSIDSFWSTLGERLLTTNNKLPLVTSEAEFAKLFEGDNLVSLFQGKRAVLFIDEFDRLYQAPQQVLDSFFNVLRGIKQRRSTNCLQSFVGVGPFSILEFTNKSSSPFNIRDAVQVRYWTREEVHQIFAQYSTKIDRQIVDDVYGQTAGHPGLVCLCGKVIAEDSSHPAESYEVWVRYAQSTLTKKVFSWPTMYKMVATLREKTAEMEEVRNLISKWFLTNQLMPVAVPEEDLQKANFLAAEGAVVSVEESETFKIPSPLIHRLLLERVVSVDRHNAPLQPVPYKSADVGQVIDTAKLLPPAIACFNAALIQSSYKTSFKLSRMPRSRDKLVPQEAVYHKELYGVLRSWLPSYNFIWTEVNAGNKRCDMVINDSPSYRILLELVANEPIASVEEHIQRAKTYAKQLRVQEAWVIHFTVTEQAMDFEYPWGVAAQQTKSTTSSLPVLDLQSGNMTNAGEIPIRIMHVWHNFNFDDVRVHLEPNKVPELVISPKK